MSWVISRECGFNGPGCAGLSPDGFITAYLQSLFWVETVFMPG